MGSKLLILLQLMKFRNIYSLQIQVNLIYADQNHKCLKGLRVKLNYQLGI